MKNILFLCTGNSARSIMAEAYMNRAGGDKWRAYSAGSKPTGKPHPFALETLSACGMQGADDDQAPRSKSWDEFALADAPIMDVIVTVCDNAAAEPCPVWPARSGSEPEHLHWGFPDPAAASGGDQAIRAAFEKVFTDIRAAVDKFLAEQ